MATNQEKKGPLLAMISIGAHKFKFEHPYSLMVLSSLAIWAFQEANTRDANIMCWYSFSNLTFQSKPLDVIFYKCAIYVQNPS
jgi:hypothetical protein